jgi:hypothetical protein
MNILKKLTVIATKLDSKGLYKEASVVDSIIQKISADEKFRGDKEFDEDQGDKDFDTELEDVELDEDEFDYKTWEDEELEWENFDIKGMGLDDIDIMEPTDEELMKLEREMEMSGEGSMQTEIDFWSDKSINELRKSYRELMSILNSASDSFVNSPAGKEILISIQAIRSLLDEKNGKIKAEASKK